jgi:hypothetical protein
MITVPLTVPLGRTVVVMGPEMVDVPEYCTVVVT